MKCLTDADVAYIVANFASLEEVCRGRTETPDEVRRLMCAEQLPQPTYILDGGTEMVPRDYFTLVDEAGGIEGLRECFVRRYVEAASAHGEPTRRDRIEKEWRSYLSGEYGACLRVVTPETVFRKELLVGQLDRQLRQPQPYNAQWGELLRARVEELDSLEREFAPYDRVRFGGPTSRDRFITGARKRFPDAFLLPGAPAPM
jgi:uncharacterized protein DUF6058